MSLNSLLGLGAVYGLGGGGLTAALLSPVPAVLDRSPPATAFVVGMGALMLGPLLVATSDTGLDTATAGGVAGFRDTTDPSKYQPETIPMSGRVELACDLVGLGVCCLAAVGPFV
ncbi:hypothetical protein [Halomarina oriensis]|uniref:Uncharacterized protein n=1 Tax=Halomarina oriensis TaxID=671145 RepID=A0A6B0GE90_9EURY|nr:hypothetical protein [Halomarina oriensis]MWG33256.1 hypothetical protein [Halomarina oriensis]